MPTKDAPPARSPRKRLRLSPEVRRRQLLDAALLEFSERGFSAARIEDIARRAGLSKSGFYGHFQGKDEVFEALLNRAFTPVENPLPPLRGDRASIEAFVDHVLDGLYERLSDPERVAMLRLMISESARVPDLITRWHREVVRPFHAARARQLADAVSAGILPSSALTDDLSLAYAPAFYATVVQMLMRDTDVEYDRARLRRAHRRMMLTLLGVD